MATLTIKDFSHAQPTLIFLRRQLALKHLRKHASLFVKLGGALLVDLDVLDEIIESGRIK